MFCPADLKPVKDLKSVTAPEAELSAHLALATDRVVAERIVMRSDLDSLRPGAG